MKLDSCTRAEEYRVGRTRRSSSLLIMRHFVSDLPRLNLNLRNLTLKWYREIQLLYVQFACQIWRKLVANLSHLKATAHFRQKLRLNLAMYFMYNYITTAVLQSYRIWHKHENTIIHIQPWLRLQIRWICCATQNKKRQGQGRVTNRINFDRT